MKNIVPCLLLLMTLQTTMPAGAQTASIESEIAAGNFSAAGSTPIA